MDSSQVPAAKTINIRRMQEYDLGQVYTVETLSFTSPWSLQSYRYELLQNSNAYIWVAEVVDALGNCKIVGMIVVWKILDDAHIGTIAVHPGFRRYGIAAKMLATALNIFVKMGVRTAMLEVRESNIAAQRLYQKFGFEIVGRRRRYYQDNNEDALLMTAFSLDVSVLKRASRKDLQI